MLTTFKTRVGRCLIIRGGIWASRYPEKAFLGNALAVLFPIDWPEPFGLVMIESLACGTPVVAYPRGSVPEILEDGRTGWLVNNTQAAAKALARISQLNRADCRKSFDERFTSARMATDYWQCSGTDQQVPAIRWVILDDKARAILYSN